MLEIVWANGIRFSLGKLSKQPMRVRHQNGEDAVEEDGDRTLQDGLERTYKLAGPKAPPRVNLGQRPMKHANTTQGLS